MKKKKTLDELFEELEKIYKIALIIISLFCVSLIFCFVMYILTGQIVNGV